MLGRLIVVLLVAAPGLSGCAGWRALMTDDRPAPSAAFVGFPDTRDARALREARSALRECRRRPDSGSVRAYARAVAVVDRTERSLRRRAERGRDSVRLATFSYAAGRLPTLDEDPCRVRAFSDRPRDRTWRAYRSAATAPIPDPEKLPAAAPRAAVLVREDLFRL